MARIGADCVELGLELRDTRLGGFQSVGVGGRVRQLGDLGVATADAADETYDLRLAAVGVGANRVELTLKLGNAVLGCSHRLGVGTGGRQLGDLSVATADTVDESHDLRLP